MKRCLLIYREMLCYLSVTAQADNIGREDFIMERIRTKYFGDKAFYKMILAIALPIVVQNLLTNFVAMLDNVMVGKVGTDQMTGVAVVNRVQPCCFWWNVRSRNFLRTVFWTGRPQRRPQCFSHEIYYRAYHYCHQPFYIYFVSSATNSYVSA